MSHETDKGKNSSSSWIFMCVLASDCLAAVVCCRIVTEFSMSCIHGQSCSGNHVEEASILLSAYTAAITVYSDCTRIHAVEIQLRQSD